jgi:2'-5' RNA ligase
MEIDQHTHQSHGAALREHREWRPEWKHDRPCLYWYLTFDADAVADALAPPLLATLTTTSWLDPVPPPWMHLTLCDLGFVDELSNDDVDLAIRSLELFLPAAHLHSLTVGPLMGMESAIVLGAEPLHELHRLQKVLGAITESAIGHHNDPSDVDEFQPHVSLGYVNRAVTSEEVHALTGAYGDVRAELPVQSLVLAAVTRTPTHYEWTVRASFSPAR